MEKDKEEKLNQKKSNEMFNEHHNGKGEAGEPESDPQFPSGRNGTQHEAQALLTRLREGMSAAPARW